MTLLQLVTPEYTRRHFDELADEKYMAEHTALCEDMVAALVKYMAHHNGTKVTETLVAVSEFGDLSDHGMMEDWFEEKFGLTNKAASVLGTLLYALSRGVIGAIHDNDKIGETIDKTMGDWGKPEWQRKNKKFPKPLWQRRAEERAAKAGVKV